MPNAPHGWQTDPQKVRLGLTFGWQMIMEVTKQSHTSSELHIIKGHLFIGDSQITDLDHSPLHEQGTRTDS